MNWIELVWFKSKNRPQHNGLHTCYLTKEESIGPVIRLYKKNKKLLGRYQVLSILHLEPEVPVGCWSRNERSLYTDGLKERFISDHCMTERVKYESPTRWIFSIGYLTHNLNPQKKEASVYSKCPYSFCKHKISILFWSESKCGKCCIYSFKL